MPRIKEELDLLARVAEYDIEAEARTPSYCAGCPHRGTSSVIMELGQRFSDPEYMEREHRRAPADIIAHGGMGLGFVARILTAAGAREGYEVRFYHQKGLAQRNGAVVSHVLYASGGARISQRIPDGKADLILGPDHLETARGMTAADPETHVLCNTARTPTIMMLTGRDSYPQGLGDRIASIVDESSSNGADFFALAERCFADRVYANLLMLGAACQSGLLPVRPSVIEDVIRESVKKEERENNLRAFRIGRRLAAHPEMLPATAREETFEDVLEYGARNISNRNRKTGAAYVGRMREFAVSWNGVPDAVLRDFARRYADLLLHSGISYAERCAARVTEVRLHEQGNGNARYAATGAAVWGLHKAMAIKDEVRVAHLLTSEDKLAADRRRFGVDPSRGDRMRMLHINRPHFNFFGMSLEWDVRTRDWMLRLVARMKFLRRLLPGWHSREKAFRDWYFEEVIGAWLRDEFRREDDGLEALKLPLTRAGYREVVYSKHDLARRRFDELLSQNRRSPQVAS